VRDDAWRGVNAIYGRVRQGNIGMARRVEAFIRDPKQNVPKLKGSGAPAGPPI
jgi:hypothetical protein